MVGQLEMPSKAPKLCARVSHEMYRAVVGAAAKRGPSFREIWLLEAIQAKLASEAAGGGMETLPVDGVSPSDVERVRRYLRFLRRCGPREEFKDAAEDGLRAIERLLKAADAGVDEGI